MYAPPTTPPASGDAIDSYAITFFPDSFHSPTLNEFFPDAVLFEGTIFELNRIRLAMLLGTVVVALLFILASRRATVVPRGGQNVAEAGIDFVRKSITLEIMGKQGLKYLPYLVTLFFFILATNLFSIITPVNIAPTALIGIPLVLALCTWALYLSEGIRANGFGGYFKKSLFPPGVPKPMYILVTPIEALTVLIIQPFSLTLRLMANMLAGHMMLVLFFSGASYLLVHGDGALPVVGFGSAVMGFGFTLFELVVALLQAYIFTLLTAVYLNAAISHEH